MILAEFLRSASIPYMMGVKRVYMSVDIDKLDESVLGSDSPDPLRFAFVKKHSAHAGGASVPVPSSQQQAIFSSITANLLKRPINAVFIFMFRFVAFVALFVTSFKMLQVAHWLMSTLKH